MREITKILVEYVPSAVKFTSKEWTQLGGSMSLYVREALYTREYPINLTKEVMFSQVACLEGYLGPKIFITIRTFGHPERKAKFEKTALHLYDETLAILRSMGVSIHPEDRLLLIDYIDPSSVCL